MTLPVPDGCYVDPDDPRFAIPKTADAFFATTGIKVRPLSCVGSYRIRIDGKTQKPFGRGLSRSSKNETP